MMDVFRNEFVENIPTTTCPVNSVKKPLAVVNIFPIVHSRRKPPARLGNHHHQSHRHRIAPLYHHTAIVHRAALSSSLGKICDGR
mmetsp:Transcript_20672/g.30750  ORF Transcript_20672/g.30750 Transcript_20672/m.30750 type:complete len:85 (+) Transcript_20672:46-300(+)